jgi:antirestriction protein ArdC
MIDKTKPLFFAEKSRAEKISDKMVILLRNGIVPWFSTEPAINFHTKKIYGPLNQCMLAVCQHDRLFMTKGQTKDRLGSVPNAATPYNVIVHVVKGRSAQGFIVESDAAFYKGDVEYFKVYPSSDIVGVDFSSYKYEPIAIAIAKSNFMVQISNEARASVSNPNMILLKREIGLGFLGTLAGKAQTVYDSAYLEKWANILDENPRIFMRAVRMVGKSLGYLTRQNT